MGICLRLVAIMVCIFGVSVNAAVAQDVGSSSPDSDAGALHGFEKTIESDSENNNARHHQRRRSHRRDEHEDDSGDEVEDDLAEGFMDGLMDVVSTVIVDGGSATLQRVAPDNHSPSRRNDGDALIPFVRYDFGYQRVSSGIDASFHRLEGGYGPFALYLEEYGFHEAAPATVLTVHRQMFLYRVAGESTEVDFGFGRSIVTGANRTVMGAFSVRGKFKLSDYASIDFTPVWGNGMGDYELAFHLGRPYGSFTLGYRTLFTSGASLNGPFAGFALYF